MNEFTVGLALYDFLPGLLTGVGVFFLARLVQRIEPRHAVVAYGGAALVLLAGLFKATWKLEMATSGTDVGWMSNALFPMMGPGFMLLGAATWNALRRARGKEPLLGMWGGVLGLIFIAFVAADVRYFFLEIERGWFLPLLILASVANLALMGLLIAEAGRHRRWGLVFLLVLNVGMTLGLQPIAQMDNISIAMHWIEQSVTVVGAGAFAAAAFGIYRAVTADARTFQEMPAMATGD